MTQAATRGEREQCSTRRSELASRCQQRLQALSPIGAQGWGDDLAGPLAFAGQRHGEDDVCPTLAASADRSFGECLRLAPSRPPATGLGWVPLAVAGDSSPHVASAGASAEWPHAKQPGVRPEREHCPGHRAHRHRGDAAGQGACRIDGASGAIALP